LSLVYPSAFGYTVPHLQDCFSQAEAYICPPQTDLDGNPLRQEATLIQSRQDIILSGTTKKGVIVSPFCKGTV